MDVRRAQAGHPALPRMLSRLAAVALIGMGCLVVSNESALAGPDCVSLPNTGTALTCPPKGTPGTVPGLTPLPDLPPLPPEQLPIICKVTSGGGASCHRQTEQERREEAAGKIFEDIICLVTKDPSCLLPPPVGPGIYKIDAGQEQVARAAGGSYLG